MAKRRIPFTSRRVFLQRSLFVFGALASAACRRSASQASNIAKATDRQPIKELTSQVYSSAQPVEEEKEVTEPTGVGDIWTQLRQPQSAYFLFMRHALAPGTGDPANFQLGDCSTQRNLSAEGREQAARTGEAFRRNEVSVQRVLSSQWCRCVETAELMALGSVETFEPINSFFRDDSTRVAQTKAVRRYIQENADQPGVTLLVTHFVNIAALTGSGPASGELVVMRMNEAKQLEVVEAIAPF